MSKVEFNKLNKECKIKNLKLFSNPRNSASGALRSLEISSKKLHFCAYQLFNKKLENQKECLDELKNLGFEISPNFQLCKNLLEVKDNIKI